MQGPISVVIPALNAARTLPGTLACLTETAPAGGAGGALLREILVVDGGSADGTPEAAARAGARVIAAPRGRGLQLAAGGRQARGEWLLFLHADTVLGTGWQGDAAAYIADAAHRDRAAVFAFRLDDPAPAARRLEAMVGWRNRVLRLPYGDQGLLIHRDHYRRLGGFPPLALMEDVSFVRRIGRRNLDWLAATATTSAVRFQRAGYTVRALRNFLCLLLYFLGVPPRLIRRVYG